MILTSNEMEIYELLQDKKSHEVFVTRKYAAQQKGADFIAVFDVHETKSSSRVSENELSERELTHTRSIALLKQTIGSRS